GMDGLHRLPVLPALVGHAPLVEGRLRVPGRVGPGRSQRAGQDDGGQSHSALGFSSTATAFSSAARSLTCSSCDSNPGAVTLTSTSRRASSELSSMVCGTFWPDFSGIFPSRMTSALAGVTFTVRYAGFHLRCARILAGDSSARTF